MRNKLCSILAALLAALTFAPNTSAQNYVHLGLPEGAKARLGKGLITDVQYSPDGSRLAVASSIGIWLYDAQTGEELAWLTGHTGWIESVLFSPDGETLASGSNDETVRLWSVGTGASLRTLEGHTWEVNSVSFSPDGETLASGR